MPPGNQTKTPVPQEHSNRLEGNYKPKHIHIHYPKGLEGTLFIASLGPTWNGIEKGTARQETA